MSFSQTFLDSVVKRLLGYKVVAEKTFEQLSEADMHYAPNETSNSVAIIIRHMAGNMLSRWTDFLTTDGEKDWRNRDSEFEDPQQTKAELLAFWEKGWQCCLQAIQGLEETDLEKTITIRQEPLSVIDAINRQLAHYPYHVGQIIYIGKILKDQDWKNLSMPKKQASGS